MVIKTATEINETENSKSKVLLIFANIVSYILHPIFMPLIMTYALSKITIFEGITDRMFSLWLMSIAITAVFFPLFSIGLLKPLNFIKDFRMPTTKERIIPLMITMIFYFWISHVFMSMPSINVPIILKVLFLGNFWGIIVIFIINIFTKISMHTSAAGGVIGNIIVLMIISPIDMEKPLFIALIAGGIIGSARMVLGAHQKGDIWLGYIIGILVQIGAYIYIK